MLFSVIYYNLFSNNIYTRTITYNVSSNDAFPKALAFDRKLVHYEGRFLPPYQVCWLGYCIVCSEKKCTCIIGYHCTNYPLPLPIIHTIIGKLVMVMACPMIFFKSRL